jgi:hypothetical protein
MMPDAESQRVLNFFPPIRRFARIRSGMGHFVAVFARMASRAGAAIARRR